MASPRRRCCPVAASAIDASLDAAFLLGPTGSVLHKNVTARRLFDSPEPDDPARPEASSFFTLGRVPPKHAPKSGGGTGGSRPPFRGGKKSPPSEMGAAAPFEEAVRALAGSDSSVPELFDATGFKADGATFAVTVSLARLQGCRCCRDLSSNPNDPAEEDAGGDPRGGHNSSYCAFVREASARQGHLVEALTREIRRLKEERSAVDASFDGFFNISPAGTILATNDAAVEMFGWSKEEFVGRNISMICGGGHGLRHDEYLRRYLEKGESKAMGRRREVPARRRDGTEFLVELGLAELKSEDGKKTFCGFVRDISKQKEKDETLKSNESLGKGMIESSFDPMFEIDSKGIIRMVNKAAVDQFGWSEEEFLGSNISMIIPGRHGRNHDRYIQRYLATGRKRVLGKRRELTARRRDGSEFPMELGLAEVEIGGAAGERMFCGQVHDLTEQRVAREKLSAMIDSSFDPMFEVDEKGIIQLVNQAAVDQFGWSEEEFVGSNISMIVAGEHGRSHDKYISRYLATGERHVMGKKRELVAKRKNGTEFPVELGLTEMKRNGAHVFCGLVKNLTEQKAAEKRLQRKTELTAGMIDSAFDPMFQIDSEGKIQLINQAAVDHFGWSKEEFLGSNISMICAGAAGRNHDRYLHHYLKTGEKRVMGRKRHLTALRKDGSEFPIELGLSEVTTVCGERIFCGFVRDICREKFDEQELFEREKLTSAILEASDDPLLTIDENGTVYRVNAAAEETFGYQRAFFFGKNINVVMDFEYIAKHASDTRKFVKHARDGGVREIKARKSDGSKFPLLLRLAEVEGSFPILLGMADQISGAPRGTRLFVAFLRRPSTHNSQEGHWSLGTFMGSLQSECKE